MGEYRLKLRADVQQLKTDLVAAEGLANRSVKEIKRMVKSGLDLKVNLDPSQLAYQKSVLQSWTEQQNLSVDIGVRLVGMENATLEINQLRQQLAGNLQLGIQVELLEIDRVQNNLERLRQTFQNPLTIRVDDHRLTELNAHLDLKENHYRRVLNLFRSSPITATTTTIDVNRGGNAGGGTGDVIGRIESSIERGIRTASQISVSGIKETGNLLTSIAKFGATTGGSIISAATAPVRNISTGIFQGLGTELSREFSRGVSGELKSLLVQKFGAPETIGRAFVQNTNQKYGAVVGAAARQITAPYIELLAVSQADRDDDSILDKTENKTRQQAKTAKVQKIAKQEYGDVNKEVKGLEYLIQEEEANALVAFEQLRPKLKPIRSMQSKRAELVSAAKQNASKIAEIEGEAILIKSAASQPELKINPALQKEKSELQQIDLKLQTAKSAVKTGMDYQVGQEKLKQLILGKVATASPEQQAELAGKLTTINQESLQNEAELTGHYQNIHSLESQRGTLANSSLNYVHADAEISRERGRISPERMAQMQARQARLSQRREIFEQQKQAIAEIDGQIQQEMESSGAGKLLKQLGEASNAAQKSRTDLDKKREERDLLGRNIDTSAISDGQHSYREIINDVAKASGYKKQVNLPRLERHNQAGVASYLHSDNTIGLPAQTISAINKNELLEFGNFKDIVHEARHGVQAEFGNLNLNQDKPALTLLTPHPEQEQALAKRIESSVRGSRGNQQARSIEKDAYVFESRNSPQLYGNYLKRYLESQYGVGGNNYTSNSGRLAEGLGGLKDASNASGKTKREYQARVMDMRGLAERVSYVKSSLANPSTLNTTELYDLAKHKIAEIDALEAQILDKILKLKANLNKPGRKPIDLRTKYQEYDVWENNDLGTNINPNKRRNRKKNQRGIQVAQSQGLTIDLDRAKELAYQAGELGSQVKGGIVKAIPIVKQTIAQGYSLATHVESQLMSQSPKARELKAEALDRVDEAAFRVRQAASISGQFAGHTYRGMQTAENVLLDFLPLGHTSKKLIKNVAMPIAAYSAASSLPGVGGLVHAAADGMHLLSNPLAHAAANFAGNGITQFVGQALGSIPFHESVVPAVAQGLSTATGAVITGGADVATSAIAPVLVGHALKKGTEKVVAKGAQKGLAAGRELLTGKPLQLAPKVMSSLEVIRLPEPEYVAATEQAKQQVMSVSQTVASQPIVGEILNHAPAVARQQLKLKTPPTAAQVKVSPVTQPQDKVDWLKVAKEQIEASHKQLDEAITNGHSELAKKALANFKKRVDNLDQLISKIGSKTGNTEQDSIVGGLRGNIGQWKKMAANRSTAVDYIDMVVDGEGVANSKAPTGKAKSLIDQLKRNIARGSVKSQREGGYGSLSIFDKLKEIGNQDIPALGFLDRNPLDFVKGLLGKKPTPTNLGQPIEGFRVPNLGQPIEGRRVPLGKPIEGYRSADLTGVSEETARFLALRRVPDRDSNAYTARLAQEANQREIDLFMKSAFPYLKPPAPKPNSNPISAMTVPPVIDPSYDVLRVLKANYGINIKPLTPVPAPRPAAWSPVSIADPWADEPLGKPIAGFRAANLGKPIAGFRAANLGKPIAGFRTERPKADGMIDIVAAKTRREIEPELDLLKLENEMDFDRAMGNSHQSTSMLSRLRAGVSQFGSDAKYQAVQGLENVQELAKNIIKGKSKPKKQTYKRNGEYLAHSRQEGIDIVEAARGAAIFEASDPDINPKKARKLDKVLTASNTYSDLTSQDRDSLTGKQVAQLKQSKKEIKGYLKEIDFKFAEDFNAGSKLNYILKENGLSMATLAGAAKSLISAFAGFTVIGLAIGALTSVGTNAVLAASKLQDLKLAANAATTSKFTADALINRSTTQANQLGYNYQNAIAADTSFAAATKGTALELVSGDISTSLRQYNRVMGVDEQRQQLSQTAVQQMAGKGTLAAEEVFGQLAESSPGAVNVLARSQGLTIGQLRARMSEGGLNAADTLSKFGQQLNAESVNQVGAASETTSAKIGKFQNSVLALQTAGGEKLLAPAAAGLGVFNSAVELLTHNIDTLAKVGTAGFIALTISGIALAAKLLPVQMGFSGIQSMVTAALPSLLKFAGQAALAYAGIELLSFVFNSFQNKSPLKGMAEEMEALAAKTSGSVDQIKESLDKLKETKYSKDRGIIGTARDFIQGGLQKIGVNTTTTVQDRENEDILTADRVLTSSQKVLDNKPDLKIAATIKERESLAQELSILRAQRATLTSRDRDKLESNASREQKIIKRQGELDFPISERQAQLEGTIKSNRAIAEDPTLPDSARASARSIIKDAETQQRLLQAEISRTSDKVQDLSFGLRKLTFGLSSTIQSIENTSQLQNAQIYSSASTDPRNTGALQGSQSTREIGELGAKRAAYQQDLKNYQSVFAQNQPVLSALGVNPDKTSKEQLDYLTKNAQDPQSQQILSYVQQYQQVKQQFLQSNQQLFQSQYSYLKAIADYNKGLADQLRTLQQSVVTQSIQARSQISALQEGVENQRLEVDKTGLAAFRQRQQNSLNSAYNSFLQNLGIAQDSLFGDIFGSFDRILESFNTIRSNRLEGKGDAIGQNYKEINNQNKGYQADTEETYRVKELNRQNSENQLNNPGQRVEGDSAGTSYTTQPYKVYSSGRSIDRADQIAEHHDGKAYRRRGHDKYRSDGGVERIVKDIVLADAQGRQNVPVPAGVPGFLNMVPAAKSGGYGNMAEIRNDQQQVVGRFAHLASFNPSLKQGQQIDYGQPLGIQGNTGHSTGTHLHYEVPQGIHAKYIADLRSGNFSNNSSTYQPVPKVPSLSKVGSKPEIFNQITPASIAMIKQHEGFHQQAYRDTDGVPTIGHGTRVLPFHGNRPVKMGDTIAQPEANAALGVELQQAKDIIAKNIRVPLNKNQLSALVSFTFNGGEQMIKGEMADTINKGDFAGAAKLFPKFNKAMVGGKLQPLAGLTKRRNAEAVMFATPSSDIGLGAASGSTATSTNSNYVTSSSLQGEVDTQINASTAQGQKIVTEQKRQYQADTETGRDRVRQKKSLRNQQNEDARLKAERERLLLRNNLDRNIPQFQRKSAQVVGQVEAQVSAASFTISPLDRAIEQYGGVRSQRTTRDEIVTARSQAQQILADNTARRIEILNQITNLIALGKGWAETKKKLQVEIANYERNGDTQLANALKLQIKDTDARIGSPQARQKQINSLSTAYRNQNSPGQDQLAAVSQNLAETSSKLQVLNEQYLPKTSDNIIAAEARGLLEQYANLRKTVTGEIAGLNRAIEQLTIDFAAEKDPEKKRKLGDALATAQLNRDGKVAERTQLDADGVRASGKLVRDRNTTEQIATQRASADFYEQRNPGNLYVAAQVDTSRLGAGKQELDLQLQNGQISAERYNLELEKLKYNTDTYRKSVEALRPAANGLFTDIFAGSDILAGAGNAIVNFLRNIAKQFEQTIAQHLGDQLMGSLSRGAGDIKTTAAGGGGGLIGQAFNFVSGLLGFGGQPQAQAYGPQYQPYAMGGVAPGGFRAFATGGVVKTPTVGLVGEGAYNEAIVPLPDGKSIPVVMNQRNDGGSGGGSVNSNVSVTVNNSGSQEISSGAASALNNMIKTAVVDIMSRERRAGGLAY